MFTHKGGEVLIMTAEEIEHSLAELAENIIKNEGENNLCVIGIKRRGDILAKRLADYMKKAGKKIEIGSIDITLYRDDLTTIDKKPVVHGTEIPFNIDDKVVILVDDVIYTGRTIRAALTELADLGRPKRIRLCCLIDRGHRELPICPDYVGKFVKTTQDEIVEVCVKELDGKDEVRIVKRKCKENSGEKTS